jgi:hypothetical protein
MALEWERDRHVGAPLVGRSVGVTYRLYDSAHGTAVHVTVAWGDSDLEHDLGVFPTLQIATRFTLGHYADAGRNSRQAMIAKLRKEALA